MTIAEAWALIATTDDRGVIEAVVEYLDQQPEARADCIDMGKTTIVEAVAPMRLLIHLGLTCKVHPAQSLQLLDTTNEWKYYCQACDMRYNTSFEGMNDRKS